MFDLVWLARSCGGGCTACSCSWRGGWVRDMGHMGLSLTVDLQLAMASSTWRSSKWWVMAMGRRPRWFGFGPRSSVDWRPDFEPPQPDPSLHFPFAGGVGGAGWILTCGGRSFSESHIRLQANNGDTRGHQSYPIESIVLGPLTLRLGVLTLAFLWFLAGCSADIETLRLEPVGLVRW